ncbi:Gfo/Idh/MocA family protein [Candidatus Phycosocius spiralis]|uniref:Oxidoreductase n=1 Tax=Candidatus Phycosocius spiralis TaxID=2815099 RepID=A0ABQ4PUX9_9PROT|nr:Gfo/Idh/MocA family oxidoreductase [Candidatus Phycosocius spiralis]GIU66821.1 oxidoreductase [Candidatus Phycosocius spiralis]
MTQLSNKKVRIGVAGAGVFGRNHAKKIISNPRATLVGIFDLHQERAEALAREMGSRAFISLSAILGEVDALVVATPAVAHGGVARAAIDAGKHCLVEKPLAATSADADILCQHAAYRGVILQAGHQERYIFTAMGLFEVKEQPQFMEATRIGLPSNRGADVSVTLDLMIHDIDVARLLFRSEPMDIRAQRLVGRPENPDTVEAVLTFKGGGQARFLASRVAEERDRRMMIGYHKGVVEIDFIAKRFKDEPSFGLYSDFASRIPDPMDAATTDFIAAILNERQVSISGLDGAAAVRIAEAIDHATRT